MTDTFWRRRVLVVGVFTLLAQGLAAAPADAQTPPQNLLVEVRQGSAFTNQSTGGGWGSGPVVSGGVVISGGSGGFGGGGVGIGIGLGSIFGGQTRSNTSNAVTTQIRVLDGGRALVQSASSQPLVLLTRVGPNLVPSTVFINAGSSIALQPRLAAASAAPGNPWAEVTLSAQQAQVEQASPGLPSGVVVNTQGASTTLQVPLGEWVTVAEQVEQASTSQTGVVVGAGGAQVGGGVASEQRSRSGRFVVQIRVTAAP